ncbi:MAG TPA: HPr(Ser) kinase/phosphatase [Polyangiaceae bacterium]|nr:HPr(Ser) kinase/phosphatase [Polyangiaceae bacterium]
MQPSEHPVRSTTTAGELLNDKGLSIELRLVAGGAGLARRITHTRIQKSGLALAGHFHGVVPTRIQILGETEVSYFESLDAERQASAARGFFGLELSAVIITRGAKAALELLRGANESGTPLLSSQERSSRTITAIHALLDDRLAPRTTLHGVLVDVFGVGLLLTGSSSIGKSECALDLVLRGHRLVADDVVECDYRPPGMVFGQPADLLRHHIEVRGLGILNIKDLFGVTSVRERKRIDIVVKLVEWSTDAQFDRMGVDDHFDKILGVPIRELVIPVRPGRNMGSILEIAARNQLLRDAGHHGAKEFFQRIEGALISPTPIAEPESMSPPAVRPGGPEGNRR